MLAAYDLLVVVLVQSDYHAASRSCGNRCKIQVYLFKKKKSWKYFINMSLPFLLIGFYYHYLYLRNQLNQPALKQEVCLIYRTASELINVFDQKIKIL